MPRVIDLADPYTAELAETADAIAARGFDPGDDQSLIHAALWLRRLGNNPTFLGDLLVEQLAQRHREEVPGSAYSPQVVMLVPRTALIVPAAASSCAPTFGPRPTSTWSAPAAKRRLPSGCRTIIISAS